MISLLSFDAPSNRLIASGLMLALLFLVRHLTKKWLTTSTNLAPETRRQWMSQSRNLTVVALIVGLVVVWAPQIQSVAISIFAVAAAIVIATKELIMCISGSILKASSKSFSVGDRIEINGFRGDVIDQGLLTTTMFEIGPGTITHQCTGRVISIPNSQFLNSVVLNETFSDQYVLHGFMLPLEYDQDWELAEQRLLKIANQHCAAFITEAGSQMRASAQREGLQPPSVEPRVLVQVPEPKRLCFYVRIPSPVRERGRIEQAIVRAFLKAPEAKAKVVDS